MTEIWKDIEGYEGLYQVSNLGRVKSLTRYVNRFSTRWNKDASYWQPEHIMVPSVGTNGYYSIRLSKNKNAKTQDIHRLVAKAFLDNPLGLPEVNHKDENRLNNCASNLEWCTRLYNLNYGNRTKNHSESLKEGGKVKRGNNGRAKKVICDGVIYDCITDCAEFYNVKPATLSGYLCGCDPMPKRWKALGLAYYIESEVA